MYIFIGFPDGSVGKELTCKAGDPGVANSIPGLGLSPGAGNGTNSSILAWKIPWTEESGRLSPKSQTRLSRHTHTQTYCVRCFTDANLRQP